MNNGLVVALVREGVLSVTSITLPKDEEGNRAAYSVYKFKKAVEKAFRAVQESEKELFAEVGIEDPAEFNREQSELSKVENPTTEQMETMKAMAEKAAKFNGLNRQLYDEEVDMEVTPLSWGMWRMLLDENRDKGGKDILSPFESALEGVLWKADE